VTGLGQGGGSNPEELQDKTRQRAKTSIRGGRRWNAQKNRDEFPQKKKQGGEDDILTNLLRQIYGPHSPAAGPREAQTTDY